MELSEVKSNKIIKSREAILYIKGDYISKIFHDSITMNSRINIIEVFLNNIVKGFPKILEYVYDKDELVGYMMNYYLNIKSIQSIKNLRQLKEKCIELIYIYINLKNEYNLCYCDFHEKNIYIHHNSILLLDADSSVPKNKETEILTDRYLCDFIIKMIYNTSFFDNELYYLQNEREIIRNHLYTTASGEKIETLDNLEEFTQNVTKSDIRKVLQKIPYKITK